MISLSINIERAAFSFLLALFFLRSSFILQTNPSPRFHRSYIALIQFLCFCLPTQLCSNSSTLCFGALKMASMITPVRSPIRTNQISSLYLSSTRISPSNVALKTRTLSSPSLAFSPLPEKLRVPALSTGVSGWSQHLRRRGSVEFPLVKAASDGAEIEITEGLGLSIFLLWFLLLLYFFYKPF